MPEVYGLRHRRYFAIIQTDLDRIKNTTKQAKIELRVLKDITKVASVAGSAIDLGTASLSGNPGSVMTAGALGKIL